MATSHWSFYLCIILWAAAYKRKGSQPHGVLSPNLCLFRTTACSVCFGESLDLLHFRVLGTVGELVAAYQREVEYTAPVLGESEGQSRKRVLWFADITRVKSRQQF